MEAVIQVKAGAQDECRMFSAVALDDPAHIAFVAAPDPAAEMLAQALHRAILARFARLAAATGAGPSNVCGPARLLGCRARSQRSCFSLLVIVTGPGMLGPTQTQLALNWLARPGSSILAVLPTGASTSASLPPSLRRINTVKVGIGTQAIADAVEVAAGLRKRELFLSYRRQDSSAIAETLFDVFSRAGWRVYLDRFTGSPGRSFPREIAEELVQKGAVLLLESSNITTSHWTLKEVAMARRLSLGLFAVNLPNSPTLAGINRRYKLKATDLAAPVAGAPATLQSGIAERVLRFVGQGYLEQIHFRRAVMASRLRLALAGEGLTASSAGNGCWGVAPKPYLVHLAPQPPALNALRRAAQTVCAPQIPVVIGPHRLQPAQQGDDAQWLAQRLNVRLQSEWRMTALARAMRNGAL
jgi:hypothetical protein